MSQTIRQQIAQKQAELAELERQASLLEKVEVFQTFRDLTDANPNYIKILTLISEIKRRTEIYRPKHPDYLDVPSAPVFVSIFYPEYSGGGRNKLYKEEWIDEIFDLIINTEKDENWIRDFKIIKGKLLEDMRKMNDGWNY